MSNDTLEHAQRKIDVEILALQERIRSLRTARNALSSIHRIPPEVMTQIFLWYQRTYCGSLRYISPRFFRHFSKWVQVTHVCQHWRNIVHSSHHLYATISTDNLPYAQEALKLSGSSPLTLIDCAEDLWVAPEDRQKLRELVRSTLPRVHTLWLGKSRRDFLLPHLKTSNINELHMEGQGIATRNMFPKSLRFLRLDHCRFDSYEWLSGLSNMVELTMLSFHNQPNIAVDVFLNVLDGMPQLIYLELTAMLEWGSIQANRVSPVTPRLHCLKLDDHLDPILRLLPWLAFAPRFTMQLKPYASEPILDWTPFFDQIGRHVRASSMVLRTADISTDFEHKFGMQCAEGAGESPFLLLDAVSGLRRQDLRHFWLTGVKGLPLDNIESLTTNAFTDVEDWKDTPWQRLESLRQLTLHAAASPTYLKFLVTPKPKVGDHLGGRIPFASLEELSLTGVRFNPKMKGKLVSALTEKMRGGVKLRNLSFHSGHIPEDVIRELSTVIDVVERVTT
ncbi:hypothetical protein BDN72DRAFT_492270 [Pluteus cervinus]|uniref:Uncharacterized protein n=1 Tax=Pluteus cervinus TaxID=181527 RepID=A0ACD3AYZ2_9AGAR|nr:hypothetical protein BDN72DRAFT_492270 [Pluteus cervinus]